MNPLHLLGLLYRNRLLLFFSRLLNFRFLLYRASAASHFYEVHDLNFMLAGINNLLNVFSPKCCRCSVNHRVESY